MHRVRIHIVVIGFFALVAAAAPAAVEEKPRLVKPRDYTAHLVGHAHIDLSWLWRWEETVHDIGVETFRGTLAQMARMPGLTFAQSQPAIYEAIEKDYPDLFADIRRSVRAGTWLPVGGMWAEPDLNMPDGEALARQLLYGKRYFLDKFGVDVKVGWNPDAFGHNAQLPQILSRAGLTSYVFERCAPPKTPAFRWEAKDGSALLAFVPPGWYLLNLKDGVGDVLAGVAGQTPLKDFLILYGEGDHGGGPRDSDLEAIRRYEKDKDQPRFVFSTPDAFFAKVEAAKADLPVVRGELNFTFPACYTTQTETKKNNRKAEALLLTAEKFSALAAGGGYRDYYPERDLDEAWKIVLRNQFHDILDGSSIGPVYEETNRAYREAFERGQRALDFSLETLVSAIDTRGEGTPVVVFNPLHWTRTDPVTAETSVVGSPAGLKLTDPKGGDVPVQVLERRERGSTTRFRYVFLAREIPSFGYKLYRASGTDAAVAANPALTAAPDSLENEFLRVAIDPKTGDLASVFDKKLDRELLAGPGNVLQAITDEPETMSAWELGLKEPLGTVGEAGAKIELAERGPVRAVVRIHGSVPPLAVREGRHPLCRRPAGRLRPAAGLAGAQRHDQGRVPAGRQGGPGRIRDPLRIGRAAGRRRRSPGAALGGPFGNRLRRLGRDAAQRLQVRFRRQGRHDPHVGRPWRDLSRSGSGPGRSVAVLCLGAPPGGEPGRRGDPPRPRVQ